MKEILINLFNLLQSNCNLFVIMISIFFYYFIDFLYSFISNKRIEDKCRRKVDDFKEELIQSILTNNKNLAEKYFVKSSKCLERINIIKNEELYKKFKKLREIHENFLNDLYKEPVDKQIILTKLRRL